MKPGCLKTLLLIISCLISLSCGAPELVLYTDRAEFAAYTEVFNAAQSEYWLQIVYHPSPSDILGRKADAMEEARLAVALRRGNESRDVQRRLDRTGPGLRADAGRKRVPKPAAGITALRIMIRASGGSHDTGFDWR